MLMKNFTQNFKEVDVMHSSQQVIIQSKEKKKFIKMKKWMLIKTLHKTLRSRHDALISAGNNLIREKKL